MRLIAAVVAVSLASSTAGAEPTVSTRRRTAAIAAAVFPGVLVRGTGSYLVHDKRTAKRLLVTAGIGAGAMLAGGLASGGTGGNHYFIWPAVPLLVSGTGLFVQTWLADIYRAAGADTGRPRAQTPWSIEAGTTVVHDAYRDRVLWRATARGAHGRGELAATAFLASSGDYKAAHVDGVVRILGAAPTGDAIEDGSWLGVRATGRWRKDDEDAVRVLTAEIEVMGRLDLDHLSPVLHGSFAEITTGVGIERARLADTAHETGGLLLGRFAWGYYLCERGELKLFYDHRRDSHAGGIAAGRAAGFVGSAGGAVDLRVWGPWAARAELEFGSAWVGTVALRFQGGPP
jgi:hypothetical protein